MSKGVISIEKVLNSRCSYELKGESRRNHWGLYGSSEPHEEAVKQIMRCCEVPQFSGLNLDTWFKDKHLYLGFEKQKDPLKERLLHIESGMQHEAVYLACTALGFGTCIHNQGIDGTDYGSEIATASQRILEIVNPYEEGKFTTKAPGPERSFLAGKNLSAPMRDGEIECLPELGRLKSFSQSGSSATEQDISQLLWAAKGRTPHYVGFRPWGLTIPTWGHGQDYTDLYLFKDGGLFRYVNWTRHIRLNGALRKGLGYVKWGIFRDSQVNLIGNPTHELAFLKKVNNASQLLGSDTGIILCRNEKTNRALWEVGYMLENMFLQAGSLGISYKSKVFEDVEIVDVAQEAGIAEASAAFLL